VTILVYFPFLFVVGSQDIGRRQGDQMSWSEMLPKTFLSKLMQNLNREKVAQKCGLIFNLQKSAQSKKFRPVWSPWACRTHSPMHTC
jgi:hypothetical protein